LDEQTRENDSPVSARSSAKVELKSIVSARRTMLSTETNVLANEAAEIPSFRVLDVRVNSVQIPEVVQILEQWIGERGSPTRYVAVTGMHGISVSREDPQFRAVLDHADLVVADGMPLVWMGRWHGHRQMKRRACGPELFEAFCQETGSKYRQFFYGGAPGVADLVARSLQQRHGIQVAGTYCPPFRALTAREEADVQRAVIAAAPDVLWVGLSTPKQEKWMYQHRHTLPVPVMLGVGAAFDMSSGRLKRAPKWMGEHGLEWFFRLTVEPARLWRRYIINGSKFAWAVCWEDVMPRIFR
jgi:N-acetylglucosaminyldiphosphoundecaprenol N-acetyl-beta-D-mannosaminyltransferase